MPNSSPFFLVPSPTNTPSVNLCGPYPSQMSNFMLRSSKYPVWLSSLFPDIWEAPHLTLPVAFPGWSNGADPSSRVWLLWKRVGLIQESWLFSEQTQPLVLRELQQQLKWESKNFERNQALFSPRDRLFIHHHRGRNTEGRQGTLKRATRRRYQWNNTSFLSRKQPYWKKFPAELPAVLIPLISCFGKTKAAALPSF